MTERKGRHPRTEMIWTQLGNAVDQVRRTDQAHELDVVDVGGGSGTFAVPLGELGHRVIVVDPSPNALATLERRARDAGVADRVGGVQDDAAGLLGVVGESGVDLALCHGVLEVVDDPGVVLADVAACLRPGGLCSVVAAGRHAAVIAKALTGNFVEARRILGDPDGRWGPSDPLPHRFDEAELSTLLADAGLVVDEVHGVRVFTDLVPGSVVDDPGESDALAELEAAAVRQPAYRAVASALHVIAYKAGDAA